MKLNKLISLLCVVSLFTLSGCSWFGGDKSDMGNKNDPMTDNSTTNNDTTKKSSTIQDMVNSFDEVGLQYENMTPIENMDFAAHEGRMFDVNGERVYLYRMNMEDKKMMDLMKQANDTGLVTVNNNGVDEEYYSLVNNDYMMLYRSGAVNSSLDQAFTNFTMK